MSIARALGGAFLLFALTFAGFTRAQGGSSEYRLGPGDAIRITVFQNPDLTLETQVGSEGRITYPLIGTVKIGGLTVVGAERAIAQALQSGHYIKEPQVTIVVTQIRSVQVSVLGEVGRPGRFPLETPDMRIAAVIAMAGGIAPGGADVVILSGTRHGKPFRSEIDVPGIFLNNDTEDNIVVAGGDVLYVPRAPMFYIYGEVQRPGSYRIERGMTIRQALVQGGGLTPRGTEKGLRVYRRDAAGKIAAVAPDLDEAVRPQDVLRVGESLF